MNILIKVIPHEQQAYPTLGNYGFEPNGDIWIAVSDLGNWRMNMLIAFHEMTEVLLVKYRGIKDEDIVAFDKAFEATRGPGNFNEPGDAVDAPYRKEHFFATTVERLLATELGVLWSEYEAAADMLVESHTPK